MSSLSVAVDAPTIFAGRCEEAEKGYFSKQREIQRKNKIVSWTLFSTGVFSGGASAVIFTAKVITTSFALLATSPFVVASIAFLALNAFLLIRLSYSPYFDTRDIDLANKQFFQKILTEILISNTLGLFEKIDLFKKYGKYLEELVLNFRISYVLVRDIIPFCTNLHSIDFHQSADMIVTKDLFEAIVGNKSIKKATFDNAYKRGFENDKPLQGFEMYFNFIREDSTTYMRTGK